MDTYHSAISSAVCSPYPHPFSSFFLSFLVHFSSSISHTTTLVVSQPSLLPSDSSPVESPKWPSSISSVHQPSFVFSIGLIQRKMKENFAGYTRRMSRVDQGGRVEPTVVVASLLWFDPGCCCLYRVTERFHVHVEHLCVSSLRRIILCTQNHMIPVWSRFKGDWELYIQDTEMGRSTELVGTHPDTIHGHPWIPQPAPVLSWHQPFMVTPLYTFFCRSASKGTAVYHMSGHHIAVYGRLYAHTALHPTSTTIIQLYWCSISTCMIPVIHEYTGRW